MQKKSFTIAISILFILLYTAITLAAPACELQEGDWVLCTETKEGQFNTTAPSIIVTFQEQVNINDAELIYVADLQGNVPASSPEYEVTGLPIGANKYNYTSGSHLSDGIYEFLINATNINGVNIITQVTFQVNVSAMPIWITKPSNIYVEKPDFGVSTTNDFFLEIKSQRKSICKYSKLNPAANHTLQWHYENFPFEFTNNESNPYLNYKTSFDINYLQTGYNQDGGELIPMYIICNETESERYSLKTVFLAVDKTDPVIQVNADPLPVLSFEDRRTNLTIETSDLAVCRINQINPIQPSGDTLTFQRNLNTAFTTFDNFTRNYSEIVTVFADPSTYDYELNIVCDNLANQQSQKEFTLNVDLDMTEGFEFLSDKPPSNLNSTTVNISGTVVNSYTECDYLIDDSTNYKHMTRAGNLGGRSLLTATETASEGEHTITVNCTGVAGTKQKTFKVDTTPPTLEINASQNTCSLSRIKAEFPVTDPNNGSGPDKVYYNISFEGNIIDDILGTENVHSGIAELSKSIPSGLEGENFTITAKAQDNAGNIGTPKTSPKMTVTNSSLLECDETPPHIILNESFDEDAKEWTILVNCTDGESGCKGEFKYSTHTNQSELCSYSSTKNLMDPITFENSSRLCIAVYDMNNNNGTISKIYNVNYPLFCYNGIKDDNETDVDCGGDCMSCELNSTCAINSDCLSNYCYGGICKEASCSDGVKNGQESSIDCGGPTCNACEEGRTCTADTDCLSRNCNSNVCAPASCTNNKKDGSETSLNCGGPDCQTCNVGQACLSNSDCTSGYCNQNKECAIDPSLDTDGDGMSDACELEYFGCETCANANADPDRDRYTNAEECQNGTDPTDPNSKPDFEKLNIVAIIMLALGGILFLGGIGILLYQFLKDKDLSQLFSTGTGSNRDSNEESLMQDVELSEDMPQPESIVNIKKNLTPDEIKLREKTKEQSSRTKKVDRKKFFDEFGETSYKSPVKQAPRQPPKEVKIQKEAPKEKPEPVIKKDYLDVSDLKKKNSDEDVFEKLKSVSKKGKSKKK